MGGAREEQFQAEAGEVDGSVVRAYTLHYMSVLYGYLPDLRSVTILRDIMMAKELAYGKFFRTHPLKDLPWLFTCDVTRVL